MATEVRRRRGTTIEHSTFTGAVAELTVDLTKDTVVVHDGSTLGGFPLLREDFSNVPTTAPFTNISLDTAIFDTTYTETGSETQGTLYWNSDEETLSLVTNGESIELGQKVEVHVKNQTGAQINKGEVVYASGTIGASGRILVTKMIADGTVAAKRVLGVAAENIADGADGKVIKFGKLRQINTSTFSNGDILWVSTTTAGAFQNTEPVQANGEISLPIAYVVYSSASVGEIFVRVTPIDENEYQDYDAGLQDISGLTPSDSTIIVGDGTNWVAESGDTARASLGLTIGTHVQAWDAQLDTLSGLSADQATAIVAVTASEYQQLQNIDTVTISNTQWGYLGELDQSLTQASSPTFSGLTVDGLVVEDEIRTLQSDVIENHLEIESLQDNKVEVGFLFPDGDSQALGTGDNATFNTVTLSEQADSANEAVRADRTVSAGNGLTGGGALTGDVTISMDTPSTLTVSTSNAVTTGSHTHALDLSGRSITLSNDSDAVITFDTNTQNLGADRTYTPTIADHASGQRGVLSIGAQDIYGSKTFINDLVADANVGTSDFISQTTGWNVTSAGAADFRSLYSDEIRTEAFIAEISEALVGADFLTKSRGVLSRNFTIPSNGNTGTLYVEDLEGFEGTQVFSDNDWLRLRVIDKSGGGLVVADVYGQVTSYTDLSGGEQSWTFTTDDDGGSSGSVIYAGSVALDYGQSGDGFIVRTTLDSQGSPYSQTVRWTNAVSGSPDPNDPDTTYTVLTRIGELGGIASLSGAGLYAKDRVYFDFGDADIFQIGKDVGGAGSHGVRIDANNYWYGTGEFKVSNGTQFLELSSGDLTGTFGDITFSSDTFTLDAGTAYLSSSGTPIMALDTSDASVANISTGTGFYADGAGNLRIGDSSTYLKFDTTNGLQIKIGNDDLSTAIADIRSDLIDIYLADQSTFSGIQFLSGQLVLKAGTGNSIASITLDGTQEDVSTISLDADYIVVTGTTIFKSAKDGSTTPDTLGDATFIDGGTIVTNSITATEIAADTITASQIAANTITANEIAANTITASEIAAGTITATEIASNTITANEIDANTITANEIATNTITASEIAAGTITANEIDVNNLFAQEIEVTGKLLATDGTYETTVGKLTGVNVKIGASTSNGDFYGLYRDLHNYFGIHDGDVFAEYAFRVGDANNYLEFDGTDITINTDTFDLDATTLIIDSGTNSGKIALGATPPTAYNSGTGIYFDGTGKALIGAASGNKIQFDGTNVNIQSTSFNLESSTVQLGDSIELSTSEITTTYDYTGSTLVFSGLFNNTYNYFGYLEDIDDVNPDGYVFRVGDATNFMELNTSNNVAQIKFDTFDLTSGNLRIKSVGTTYPSASANTEVTTADVTDFRIATLGSGFDTNSLAISNNRWVKFQFDYSQSVPGSFTAGITVTLKVSTDNSTFTDYGLFSDTRIDFNTNYFVADNATGNRLNVVDQSDSTKTEFKFTSSQTDSCTGTITMYFYVNEKDTTTHVRFNVLDSSGTTLTGASATNIGTRDYNPVTELNPSGIFTRLSDSLILSNGNTYIDYSLIT